MHLPSTCEILSSSSNIVKQQQINPLIPIKKWVKNMMLTISQWSLQKIVYPDYMLHFSKSHQGYLFQTCLREGTHKLLVFSEISPQGFQANSSKRTNFSTHDDEQGQYCQD